MSHRVKWTALWTVVGGLVTLALIIVGVDRFEAQLTKINWPLVSLMSLFVFGGFMIYRWNDELARYNLIDLVMNPVTGKPDPYRHLLFLMSGLGAWACIQVVLAKQWDVLTPLLTLLIGAFVAKPTLDGFSDAIARRPPAEKPVGPVQVNAPHADTVNVPAQPAAGEAASEFAGPPTIIPKAKKRKR